MRCVDHLRYLFQHILLGITTFIIQLHLTSYSSADSQLLGCLSSPTDRLVVLVFVRIILKRSIHQETPSVGKDVGKEDPQYRASDSVDNILTKYSRGARGHQKKTNT